VELWPYGQLQVHPKGSKDNQDNSNSSNLTTESWLNNSSNNSTIRTGSNNSIQCTNNPINIIRPTNCMKCMTNMQPDHIRIVTITAMAVTTFTNNSSNNIMTWKWTED
jgi:hypothetical protein